MLVVLRKIPCFYLLTLYFFLPALSGAQERVIETIPNQPSPEVYDLLQDRKGYIWLAHNLGVSRYDGSEFITLQNPRQNSISMTDLVEDKKGRIWCHNFSGQIFYIENMQLHLLTAYKYEEEPGYPRIVVCGDELVASSAKGLFVFNLLTEKASYYEVPLGTNSVARVGNKVICFSNSDLYCYEAGKPITKLKADLRLPENQVASLQNHCTKDTFYLIANPTGIYYKLTLDKQTVKVHARNQTAAFINTVSVQGDRVWVNTKERSFTSDEKTVIHDMDLSDVLTDHQGNQWMSSLKKGLCVQYNAEPVKKLDNPVLEGQNIRRLYADGDRMFLGSADGSLYQWTATSLQYVLSIPKQAGAIEYIFPLGREQILLAASVGSYVYTYATKEIKPLPVNNTAKDVLLHEGMVYLATTVGIKRFPQALLKSGHNELVNRSLFDRRTRCRSITLLSDSLIAAYSDGVYVIRNNTIQPLYYRGNPIYATTVRTIAGKLLIGTFNQGLLVLENGRFKQLSEKEGLASGFIKEIKIINGAVWLIYADRLQQLNAAINGVEDYAIPFDKGGINDFSLLDGWLYITTGVGIYQLPIVKHTPGIYTATYIDKIMANGRDLPAGNHRLKYFQNHLQFQVSTPFFSPYSKLIYQYRVKNLPENVWQEGAPGQTAFNLVALEPGIYEVEIVATDEANKVISRPATYRFEITPPWYRLIIVKLIVVVVMAAICFYLVWLYYRGRLRRQRLAYEKELAVQAERQRISAEIHDDVGAGLSALRLLTEVTKNRLPESEIRQELAKVHASISELSHKMREVIWSLNADNDNLENLLFYIRRQALLLFENSPVNLKVAFPPEIPFKVIKGEKRRHIYLAVKEALHNCLKHSDAKTCLLSMSVEGSRLIITIADDGKGFASPANRQTGNGLPGMKKRMQQIDGLFELQVQERTVVQLIIPLTEKA